MWHPIPISVPPNAKRAVTHRIRQRGKSGRASRLLFHASRKHSVAFDNASGRYNAAVTTHPTSCPDDRCFCRESRHSRLLALLLTRPPDPPRLTSPIHPFPSTPPVPPCPPYLHSCLLILNPSIISPDKTRFPDKTILTHGSRILCPTTYSHPDLSRQPR
ncbi:hypothetical protein DM02DRAFT_30345 [Periconia macrospinosa]|uniref:Uncharacterized protein n=1 Tax=Periconia macrospinosa TaxID=97972 RepID=A0A2V1DMD8_9PLEO|nr:hypothetical protein DM02DRAFT_30345 [Periconia macrospinosa]